jgi:hypothetical protein
MQLKIAALAGCLLATPALAGGYGEPYGYYYPPPPGVYMEKRLYVNGVTPPPEYVPPPRRCCAPPRRSKLPHHYFRMHPQNQINIGGDNFGGASIINQN